MIHIIKWLASCRIMEIREFNSWICVQKIIIKMVIGEVIGGYENVCDKVFAVRCPSPTMSIRIHRNQHSYAEHKTSAAFPTDESSLSVGGKNSTETHLFPVLLFKLYIFCWKLNVSNKNLKCLSVIFIWRREEIPSRIRITLKLITEYTARRMIDKNIEEMWNKLFFCTNFLNVSRCGVVSGNGKVHELWIKCSELRKMNIENRSMRMKVVHVI